MRLFAGNARTHHGPRFRGGGTGLAAVLLLTAATALASCGGDDGAATTPYSPSPGLGTVLLVVPDTGFQEVEYAAVRDALDQAGYHVRVANALGGESISSDDDHVSADLKIADAQAADYQAVVLIGGPGTVSLFDDTNLRRLVGEAAGQGELVGAICLAPVILARAGLLDGKQATVWRENRDELDANGCTVRDKPVVVDGRIITGSGPDAATQFASAIVSALRTEE